MPYDEQPVSIALNGVRRIVLSCSSHDLEPLALGHLLAEGWIRSAADVRALTAAERTNECAHTVFVDVDPVQVDLVELVRRHQTLYGCGLRHVLECDPFVVEPVRPTALPSDAAPLLRALFAAADERAPGGGVHAAALSDGTTLVAIATDVARHCAVDRAIGHALREGMDLPALGLVCTARVSGAMALKTARARLGWIASRSTATSLAREIAAAFGVLLIERAGRPPLRA